MNRKVTSFIVLMLVSMSSFAQTSFSDINIAHQYRNKDTYATDVYAVKEGMNVTLYTSYDLPDTATILPVTFWGAPNYKDPVRSIDSLINSEVYLGKFDGRHYYKYEIVTDYNVIAVEVILGKESSEIYDIRLDPVKYPIILMESPSGNPYLKRWVNRGDDYITLGSNGDFDHVVTYFDHQFDPALPPMASSAGADRAIMQDSIFVAFESNDLSFEKEGFYLFQNDTSELKGFGWRVESESFPSYNKIEQLIPPLKYITTPKEYADLTAVMNKTSFDRFWLNLAGNTGAARNMISNYYRRVSQANEFFTTYKEGWKTDQGMVYIVYGAPDEVFRNDSGEIWVYKQGIRPEVFNFGRFSHVFYPDNYVLVRDGGMKQSWFRAVDQIRNNNF